MIVQVAVPYELAKSFDYVSDVFLMPGSRVVVDFAGRKIVAVVVAIKGESDYEKSKLKKILFSLDKNPSLSDNLLELSAVMSRHYLYGRGAMLELMLPKYFRKMNRFEQELEEKVYKVAEEQEYIYFQENNNSEERFHKYCSKIDKVLDQGRSVIVTVPNKEDIEPLSQFISKHCELAKIAKVSADNKEKEAADIWLMMRQGEVNLCVGTRMALFAPFESVGLLVVDKENAYGHIHGQKPFFHSRDIALFRAKIEKADVYFHSDYPTVEMYHFLQKSRFEHCALTERTLVDTLVYDLNDYNFKRYPIFADLCTGIMRRFLESKKKVMVFWNRKGFSNLVRCDHCKTILKCTHCDNSVSYDKSKNSYRCSKCGRNFATLSKCPSCKHDRLKPLGVGVERVKQNYIKFFPEKQICVLDEKNTEVPEDWDLIVATQKFLESNKKIEADLVVIAGIDQQLSLGDYNTSYDLFLTYKRLHNYAKEHCVVFTLNPDYYPVESLNHKEDWFYEQEMQQRKDFELPPYVSIATLVLRSKSEEQLNKKIKELENLIQGLIKGNETVELYGPMEENPYRMRGQFYMKLIIKARSRKDIQKMLSIVLDKFKKANTKLSIQIQ